MVGCCERGRRLVRTGMEQPCIDPPTAVFYRPFATVRSSEEVVDLVQNISSFVQYYSLE